MWLNDIQRAIEIFKQTYGTFILVEKILPSYDGIVFRCTNGYSYRYYNMTDTIKQLPKNWRENPEC